MASLGREVKRLGYERDADADVVEVIPKRKVDGKVYSLFICVSFLILCLIYRRHFITFTKFYL